MSAEALLQTIYRYYPRGLDAEDDRYFAAVEHRRLVDARKAAGANSAQWVALLDRLASEFPECVVTDRSGHLATGRHDAGYFGEMRLPLSAALEGSDPDIAASVARLRATGIAVPEPHGRRELGFLASFLLPYHVVYEAHPEAVRFVFDQDLQRYADAIARELAATYRSAPMSPDVGLLIIPDLTTEARQTVTIFDAVFSDHPRWCPP